MDEPDDETDDFAEATYAFEDGVNRLCAQMEGLLSDRELASELRRIAEQLERGAAS